MLKGIAGGMVRVLIGGCRLTVGIVRLGGNLSLLIISCILPGSRADIGAFYSLNMER
jgi:hypothetical protein